MAQRLWDSRYWITAIFLSSMNLPGNAPPSHPITSHADFSSLVAALQALIPGQPGFQVPTESWEL